MFVLRPSSPLRIFEPTPFGPAPAVEAEPEKKPEADQPYVDTGLPVPDYYEIDIVRAMLQDPFRIFIYWEVRDESLAALTRYFSDEEAAKFTVTLRLTEVEGRDEAFFKVGRRGRYWMMVFPDREYEFEIGVRSPDHGFIPLVRSNRVRTPRGTVSPSRAPEGEYRLSPPEFVEVIEASGFAAEQALSVTISALPAAAKQDGLESSLAKLPSPLREAIITAAGGGTLTHGMVEGLPEPLKSELTELLAGGGGQVASAGLMHYLPEILREVMEDSRELLGDHIHPLHIAPRFFAGGSENVSWPAGDIRWPGLPRRPSSAELIRGR